jgi:hypothetical protein
MSIVAVHGPYTFGSKAVSQNSSGTASATVNPANGLIWTFNAADQSQPAANYDWTYTPAGGAPASPINDTKSPVITFTAGTKTVTLTLNGVAQPPITVTAVAGTGPQTGLMSAPIGGDDEPQAQARSIEEAPEESAPDIDVGYDPAAHTVAEVEEFVAEHPEQLREMYDAEVAGKNRTTLVNHLESLLPFDPAEYSVEDVKAYVEDNPDEAIDVLNQERQGKNRSTLVSFLEDLSTVE